MHSRKKVEILALTFLLTRLSQDADSLLVWAGICPGGYLRIMHQNRLSRLCDVVMRYLLPVCASDMTDGPAAVADGIDDLA